MMRISAKKVLVIFYVILFILIIYFIQHRDGQIRLIVRGDDMGFSHYANAGCIKAYQEGILTAVEVMVPCDYFMEAVNMLKKNPGLDVGIHLTLNSEWENIKWGPLTNASSLVDENGYFFPMTWPDAAYPSNEALGTSNWRLEEIERELRAQIELILSHLPHCSHATPHMGFHTISPEVRRLIFDLVKEYNIDANLRYLPLRQVSLFGDANTLEEMIANAVKVLDNLTPGTWDFYDHPGMILEGEEFAWHIGAEDDAIYRDRVTKILISKELQEVIERRNIQLIGYRELEFWH
jgi:predicted glycoside hydrolase/deacetylase ChbG (UPF0249 family)